MMRLRNTAQIPMQKDNKEGQKMSCFAVVCASQNQGQARQIFSKGQQQIIFLLLINKQVLTFLFLFSLFRINTFLTLLILGS
jgi:hypothetical protein